MMAKPPKDEPGRVVSRTINNAMAMIEEFRKVEPSITANAILAFMFICIEPGITGVELQRKMGLNNSTVVRVVASLSSHHRGGKDGHDLIRYKEDYIDRRVKHLHLTPHGEYLWKRVCKALEVSV